MRLSAGLYWRREHAGAVLMAGYGDRGALRGTPGSAYPQPERNATELPSSAPGRAKLIKLPGGPRASILDGMCTWEIGGFSGS